MLCVRTEFRKAQTGGAGLAGLRQGRTIPRAFSRWERLSLLQVHVLYVFDGMAEEALAQAPEFLD